MIKTETQLNINTDFDFDLIAPKERIVFFDIETTGLSSDKAMLYLIGTVTYDRDKWILRQFFSEGLEDEEKLLNSFFKLLSEKRRDGRAILISYNGDGFDIPFIKNVVSKYMLPYDFCNTLSLDMYKAVKPYREFLGLCDCKLKSVEKLCGIFREDKYSGGDLIYVYEEYIHMSYLDRPENAGLSENNDLNRKLRESLLKTLLLHNAEDISDMPLLMNVFATGYLFKGEFDIEEAEIVSGEGKSIYRIFDRETKSANEGKMQDALQGIQEQPQIDETKSVAKSSVEQELKDCAYPENTYLNIRARLKTPLPKGIYRENPLYTLSICEEDRNLLELSVRLFQGELKYFYVDYKNYYYLTEEDCAVHKSVGEFVDRKFRKQATASTCYQKINGIFLFETEPVFTPVFHIKYKGREKYAQLRDVVTNINANRDILKEYVLMILKGELHGCNR